MDKYTLLARSGAMKVGQTVSATVRWTRASSYLANLWPGPGKSLIVSDCPVWRSTTRHNNPRDNNPVNNDLI